jgi:hypothetical protein
MDAYGDVEILGEAISEGSRCNFVNGKAEGITGILKYNNGVLDRKYVYEKLSESYLSDEKIKEVAYGIWEKNGRVEGQNERNWYDAKWQMESLLEMDSSFFIDIGSIWPDTVRQRTKELVDGIINEVA